MNNELQKAPVTTGGQVLTMSPDSFIQQAIESNAPVETLEKLMTLKERHETNEARKAFFAAMQMFQGIKPALTRSSNVNFSTQKGTTNYNFCALPDIEKALRDPLEQCELSYRFENGSTENRFSVTCIVSHVLGHSERTTMSAPAEDSGNKNKIQAIGSSMTYLMRYTLIATFGLVTADEDNDGQTNSDLPFQRVMVQNDYLKNPDTLDAISLIKRSLEEDDYYAAYEVITAMPKEILDALWIAPTKGGVFTTIERGKLKSDAYANARADYHAEKTAN